AEAEPQRAADRRTDGERRVVAVAQGDVQVPGDRPAQLRSAEGGPVEIVGAVAGGDAGVAPDHGGRVDEEAIVAAAHRHVGAAVDRGVGFEPDGVVAVARVDVQVAIDGQGPGDGTTQFDHVGKGTPGNGQVLPDLAAQEETGPRSEVEPVAGRVD